MSDNGVAESHGSITMACGARSDYPTEVEMRHIDGEAQKLGFLEFDEYPYLGLLAGNPMYAEFPMGEWGGRPPGYEEILRLRNAENVGIIVGAETGDAERREDAKYMHTVWGEFGFLIIFGGKTKRQKPPKKVTNG